MPIGCCKDCTKRELGCHSTCETYLDEKKAHDIRQAEIRTRRDAESFAMMSNYERSLVSRKAKDYGAKRKRY